MNLWFDVEDLFEYAALNLRPSGIQRVAFEICRAMQEQYGDSCLIHFVRHDPLHNSFTVVPWCSVASLFNGLIQPVSGAVAPADARYAAKLKGTAVESQSESKTRRALRRLISRVPQDLRRPLLRFRVLQLQAFGALIELMRAALCGLARFSQRLLRRFRRWGSEIFWTQGKPLVSGDAWVPTDDFATLAAPGDVLVTLGAHWSHFDYAGLIETHRERFGLRFGLLVYDIIALRRPEWFDRGLVRIFRTRFLDVLPKCDVVFCISKAVAEDLESYSKKHGITLHMPVYPIPMGTGFSSPSAPRASGKGQLEGSGQNGKKLRFFSGWMGSVRRIRSARSTLAPVQSRQLPPPGSYVLVVSTIEARKNHSLLFRVWRQLSEEMPRDRIPILVFAGRVGWLVEDLMRQLENVDFLEGLIVHIENPSDAELETLYRGCLFTLFPSLYEGWGLPVTESLGHGKPCLISNRGALPEAGGTFARYFDPENIPDAYQKIRATIEDSDELQTWAARIVREFQPASWSSTADAILRGLGHPLLGRA